MQATEMHLEAIRKEQGDEACTRFFTETAQQSRMSAQRLLGDERMSFPCLFLLMPSIERMNLQIRGSSSHQRAKYATAMAVSRQILQEEENRDLLIRQSESVHAVLLWMFKSGCREENTGSDYRKVLDIVASMLIHMYRDHSILPEMADLIFARRDREENVQDLIWIYFRSKEPMALRLIADHLPNADRGEAEFIRDLLGIAHTEMSGAENDYHNYLDWLTENQEQLVWGEENKQYISRPVVCGMTREEEQL